MCRERMFFCCLKVELFDNGRYESYVPTCLFALLENECVVNGTVRPYKVLSYFL